MHLEEPRCYFDEGRRWHPDPKSQVAGRSGGKNSIPAVWERSLAGMSAEVFHEGIYALPVNQHCLVSEVEHL